jgi:hypothetical protein
MDGRRIQLALPPKFKFIGTKTNIYKKPMAGSNALLFLSPIYGN